MMLQGFGRRARSGASSRYGVVDGPWSNFERFTDAAELGVPPEKYSFSSTRGRTRVVLDLAWSSSY